MPKIWYFMSKTYRDSLKKQIEIEEDDYYSQFTVTFEDFKPYINYHLSFGQHQTHPASKWQRNRFNDYCKVAVFYNKNPMWWNHLFTERPNRRETHKLLQFVTNNPHLCDNVIFPLAHKPKNYYW